MDWIPTVIAAMSLIQVVDGDTVKIPSHSNVRLYGLNTPELAGKCAAEKQKALQAKNRLDQLLKQKDAMPVLTIDTKECAFSRPCALLMVKGRDVAEVMITEGLAEPMLCPKGRCPRPKNWCAP